MKSAVRSIIFCASCLVCLPVAAQPTVNYNDVLLMINDSSANSVDIGNYFATRRNIPAKNIFHFQHDTSKSGDFGETIDSLTFKKKILWPLQSYMLKNNLVDSINYIVATKGCPLRVTAPHASGNFCAPTSFGDCVALANSVDSVYTLSNEPGNVVSPYFSVDNPAHFKHDQSSMPYYLTTRLDAYTVDQVKALILRSETPACVGQGLYVLDINPGDNNSSYQSGNDWMTEANDSLTQRGFNIKFDTTVVYLTKQSNVIGYCSWGSNDGNSGNYTTNAIPHNTYLNGAVGETYVSTGGRSFNPGTAYGQSLIADWIAEGITGIKGYTDEPYLGVMAEPEYLFPRMASGYNLAESYWSASPYIAWRQVVIGDPKMMMPIPVTASAQSLDFGNHDLYVLDTLAITVKNSSTIQITARQISITGGDSANFSAYTSQQFPKTLSPQDSFVVHVVFHATGYVAYGSTLHAPYRLAGNSQDQWLDVSVGGGGIRPGIVAPDTVTFPGVKVSDSTTQNIALRNTSSTDTITINSATSTNGANFLPNVILPVHILPGDSTFVPVRFTPQDTGLITGTLNFKSNATVSFKSTPVALRGMGLSTTDVDEKISLPSSISMTESFPNPFIDATTFRVTVSTPNASLKIFDVVGRMVADLSPQISDAGSSMVRFSAASLPDGVYLCRLNAHGQSLSQTIIRTH